MGLKRYQKLLILIPVLLLAWVTLVNTFPEGYIYTSGDFAQPVNIKNIFHHIYYTWNNRIGAGGEGGFFSWYPTLPYYLFLYLLPSMAGLTDSQILSFVFSMFLFLSYVSFFWMLRILFGKDKPLLQSFFSLLYALNLTTLYFFTYTWGFSHQVFLYIPLPLLIAYFYKYLRSPNLKSLAVYLILLGVSMVGFGNSAFFFALVIFMGLFTLALLLTGLVKVTKKFIASLLALGITSLLVICVWLMPTLVFVNEGITSLVSGVFDLKSWLDSQSADLLSIYMGMQRYPDFFPVKYGFKIWYVVGFLPIAMLLIFLTSQRKIKDESHKLSISILLVGVIFMLLLKKSQPPFGDLSMLLFKIPFIPALRSYEKVAIFMPFVFLTSLYGFIPERLKNSAIFLIFILFISTAPLPFYIGGIQKVYSINFAKKEDYLTADFSGLVKVPDAYKDVYDIVNSDPTVTKLQALPHSPLNTIAWVNYPKWKLIGVNPTENYFNRPTIAQNSSMYVLEDFNPTQSLNTLNIPPIWYVRMLPYFNVSDIIYHFDVEDGFIVQSGSKMEELERQNLIHSYFENDFIKMYKIDSAHTLPVFYAPERTKVINGKIAALPYIFSLDDYSVNQQFVLGKSAGVLNETDIDYIYYPVEEISPMDLSIEGFWSTDWKSPAADYNPYTIQYRLRVIKEELSLAKEKNPIRKIQLKLIHLNKRAYELSKYNLIDSHESVAAYTSSLDETIEMLSGIPTEARGRMYKGLVTTTQSYLLRHYSEYGTDPKLRELFANSLKKFQEWASEISDKNCSDFCYRFTVNKPDKYDILIDNKSFDKNVPNHTIDKLTVVTNNGNEVVRTVELNSLGQVNGNFIQIGSFEFEPGTPVRLNIKFHETPNLLIGEEWLEYKTFEEDTSGIKLRPQLFGAQPSKYKRIDSWISNTRYAVSFDYKLNSGKAAIALVEDIVGKSKEKKILDIEQIPTVRKILFDAVIDRDVSVISPNNDGWSTYKKTFTSSEDTVNGYLFIYGFSGKNNFSDIEIKNIKVQKVPDPKIIIRKFNASNQAKIHTPKIEFISINPTKYKLNITDIQSPFYLVFSESFSKEWQLYRHEENILSKTSILGELFETVGLDKVASDKHYIANGFSNGWLISDEYAKDGKLELIVEFNAQRLFYIGIVISTAIIGLSALYLIWVTVFNKLRKNNADKN
ncbi:hypothetical protein A2619_04790 [candidate division WWE3 bacterium RIFOXYD1_FULL_39_9]|uniref:Uncharacterized protein n=1 Tax=candidate division WWE3 bacterium RIFOXYD1_FULL_39_9 TaxID=1802649 RepID=A0A1F4X6J9_UNCKA|nr:MAG: hypothetical protein A2619_04790 [candidate division WWE3 bacterium RIFOXYD1_FULL_39_9]